MNLGEDIFAGGLTFGRNAQGSPLPWYEVCPPTQPEENWIEIKPFEYDIVRCKDGS